MGAVSLLVALALSADHGYATTSLQAEARAAAPLVGGLPAGLTPELSIRPSLDAGYVAGVLRATAGYQLQITATSANFTAPGFLHRAQAGVEWRLSAGRRVLVDQALTFGQYDTSLGNLGAGGAPLPVLLPLVTVDYLTSNTALGLDGSIAPRLRLRTTLGYNASGGLTDAARAQIPLQQGPRLTVELEHMATRRDALSGSLRLSADRFTGGRADGRTAAIAEGTASWRIIVTRETGLRLSGGAAGVVSVAAGDAPAPQVAPVASANFTYGVPRVRLGLDAAYSPQADALSGAIFQRAGVGVSGEYRPTSQYTARAAFGGSWAVENLTLGDRTVLGEASLGWREHPVEISAGLRVANAQVTLPGDPLPTTATEARAFVSFSLTARPGPGAR